MTLLHRGRPDAGMRLGAGAGFAGDRIDPAVELVTKGSLDALVFEVLAERTIALAQRRRRSGSGAGFDDRLTERMAAVLPAAIGQQTRIITNGGAADPHGGGIAIRNIARQLGLTRCRVAVVTGDDVLQHLDLETGTVLETGEPLALYRERLVSANAYLGIAPLLAALHTEPDVIIVGRTTDAALFLAPLVHAFGWAADTWDLLACGTVVGHLLECAGQLTGGYFADGVRKHVPDLAQLGFPYADVWADGSAIVSKLPEAGGRVDRATCLEQLLYEVEDPARYLTPDVIVDIRGVRLEEVGPNAVRVSGAMGLPAPSMLKVSVGVDGGFIGTGAISYAGPGCLARAQLAADIVQQRWGRIYGRDASALQMDLIGLTSCTPWRGLHVPDSAEPPEVRLRAAVQAFDRQVAIDLAREVESLYTNGPAGGGGVETSVRDSIAIISTLVARELVEPRVEVLE
jgi:Acyclic terpene utilisation family protein AtuA